MTKTVFSLLFLAISAFAQDGPTFKEFFEHQAAESNKDVANIQELLPIRDKAFADLSVALSVNSAPSAVREIFDRAWDAEIGMKPAVFSCASGAKLLLDFAKTAFEYKEIDSKEYERARTLATQLQGLAKAGAPTPEQVALHAKLFAYSAKESDRITAALKRAVTTRQKAAEELAKKIGGDKVKTEVYADRMRDAHFAVVNVAENGGDIRRLLWHAEYEFKDGQISEKQYDQAQRATKKLETLDDLKWVPKEQLAIYKQVRGVDGMVELVMK